MHLTTRTYHTCYGMKYTYGTQHSKTTICIWALILKAQLHRMCNRIAVYAESNNTLAKSAWLRETRYFSSVFAAYQVP